MSVTCLTTIRYTKGKKCSCDCLQSGNRHVKDIVGVTESIWVYSDKHTHSKNLLILSADMVIKHLESIFLWKSIPEPVISFWPTSDHLQIHVKPGVNSDVVGWGGVCDEETCSSPLGGENHIQCNISTQTYTCNETVLPGNGRQMVAVDITLKLKDFSRLSNHTMREREPQRVSK